MISHYGLLANTLAVPVMGMLVMPAAVLAAVLAPFGLHWIGLWLMRPGIEWIIFVAHWVASLGGAASFVPSPPPSRCRSSRSAGSG
jgi:competence protein ComEC